MHRQTENWFRLVFACRLVLLIDQSEYVVVRGSYSSCDAFSTWLYVVSAWEQLATIMYARSHACTHVRTHARFFNNTLL